MGDPRFSQNAARLSEDIGDVLTAIRRMIADDDALSSARAGSHAGHPATVQDDAGEFLARRYGGNAALARQMVDRAARPVPAVAPPAMSPAAEPPSQPIRQTVLRTGAEAAQVSINVPLRLEAERRVDEVARPTGWRAWLRPDSHGPVVQTGTLPAVSTTVTCGTTAEDEDDFAEAFDWKVRMRPEIITPEAPAAIQALPGEQRMSGWVQSGAQSGPDTVAQLAAEAAAFDAEECAHSGADDFAIRNHLRDMVQEELNGPLGERFSANLRAVIRREIAAAIDAHLDRF